ncbi:C39 family peptidase [Secundilactobacillus kimchicus]|uniref:C39 family peptidase n=1 Tax=Secundilactobacillus kimchicus TaxID=528209 RepID=UPI0024A99F1F|nr:C39 family peptidase [Secundilactobacillus kimchicus]
MKLTVPLIAQRPELPTGCEITAVTMMLQSQGIPANKVTLAREMPYDPTDCDKGFVGNPFTDDGNSIYPPALLDLVQRYAGHATDLTGTRLPTLLAVLDADHPVVVWVGEFDGFHTHALVLTGYDATTLTVNDCWTEREETLTQQTFNQIWQNKGYRALTI